MARCCNDSASANPGRCRFFYVDERKEDGSSRGADIDGPAHAEFFASLLEGDGNVPTMATFVKGKGYVDFSE